jgi:hypothetical protein
MHSVVRIARIPNSRSSVIVLWMVLVGACGAEVDEADREFEQPATERVEEHLGSTAQALGTISATDMNNHLADKSSETAITTSMTPQGEFRLTVARNTWSDPLVTFNNDSRQVRGGASLMGWTTTDFAGTVRASGRMVPPPGWAVLWGDPSTTTSKTNPSVVYLSSLGIPNAKFPASNVIEGSAQTGSAGSCGAFIGGACFARSTNGGSSFSNLQCVQRTDNPNCPSGSFYDGSDMESAPDGRIFAAYFDVRRGRTDVYASDTSGNNFARVTDPTIVSGNHPRLRWGPFGLYLLVANGSTLQLTRFSSVNAWSPPVTVDTGVSPGTVSLAGVSVRLGPQYDLAIGRNESGADEVRVAYTILSADGRTHVRVARCTPGATITCTPNVWQTDSTPGNQWGPAIATGQGNITGENVWVVTYYSNQRFTTQAAADLWRMRFSRSSSGLLTTETTLQENGQFVCPDKRGYWGDYDDMVYAGFGSFFRPFTDSSHANCVRSGFVSTPHTVALTGFNY